MASLVVSLAGGLISQSLGFGFGIGYSIASSIYSFLNPPEGPTTYGPRLRDLQVQSSAYGSPILRIYRKARVAGNVIWSSGLKEKKVKQSSGGGGGKGGGGGGGSTYITYTYSVDLAIGICEGPIIGIEQIWADSTLILDLRDNQDTKASGKNKHTIRIALGDEVQTPDSMVETDVGTGNSPAYRGLAVAYIENFQLEDYGNRVPNFTFVVVTAGSENAAQWTQVNQIGGATGQPVPHDESFVTPSKIRRKYWLYGNGAGTSEIWNSEDGITFTQRSTDAFPTKDCFVFYNDIDKSVWLIDGTNGEYRKSGDGINFDSPVSIGLRIWTEQVEFGHLSGHIWACGGYLLSPQYDGDDIVHYDPSTETWSLLSPVPWGTRTSNAHVFIPFGGYMYLAMPSVIDGTAQLWRTTTSKPEEWENISLVTPWPDNYHFLSQPVSLDGYLYFLMAQDTPSWGTVEVWKTQDLLEWEYITDVPDSPVLGANNHLWIYSTSGALYYFAQDASPPYLYKMTEGRLVASNVSLSSVVTNLCEESGLVSGDIDATQLANIYVDGYIITHPMTARDAISTLQKAFFFDLVESEYKIKFVIRGNASVVTITDNDLSAHADGNEVPAKAEQTIVQELEMPVRVNVVYISESLNYQNGTQWAGRLISNSSNIANESVAVVMSDDKAKQIAEVLLFNEWVERRSFDIKLSRKYTYLEPTDVITLVRDGFTSLIRITEIDYDVSGLIMIKGVIDGGDAYTSYATGGTNNFGSDEVVLPVGTELHLFDMPILRDVDSDAGFYAGAVGKDAGWKYAALFVSKDSGTTYDYSDAMIEELTIGYAMTVLPDGPTTIVDEGSSVDILMENGTLQSTTDDGLLSLTYAALIGSELISFRDASLIGANTYRLSGLLRGLNGTEQHTSSHALGDRFVLLELGSLIRVPMDLAYLNSPLLYKAVSYGEFAEDVSPISFTNTSIGLKPYSPVHLAGKRNASNDITISWIRRTRIGGAWRDFVDASLGESTASYEVDIMNGSTVVRTLASTTQSVTYTAAQQTTDGFTAGELREVNVYQLSSDVGRGFPANGIV